MGGQEHGDPNTMSKLVGALIEELAHDVPDDPRLETVRADLLAASRCYEAGTKKDLALRFYLAVRSLLQELERPHPTEPAKFKEVAPAAPGDSTQVAN
jgi:hypothetical protein